jgi:hypothetical protein
MKLLVVLLLLLTLIYGCSTADNNSSIIPLEYRFPIAKIGGGKTIFYHRVGPLHQGMETRLNLIHEFGNSFVVSSTYYNNHLVDSIKTTLNGALIESFRFLMFKIDGKLIKGEIIEDKIIADAKDHNRRCCKILYRSGKRSLTITEEEKFLYDTILEENGLHKNSFVTETTSTYKYQSKGKEIASEVVTKHSYYLKSRGLYRFNVESKDDSSIWYEAIVE